MTNSRKANSSANTSANNSANAKTNLVGVLVLAGGLSTRMGTPKALLTLPTGETLLDYHVSQALRLDVPIVIADNGQGFKPSSKIPTKKNSLSIKLQNVVHINDYQPNIRNDIKSNIKNGSKSDSIPNQQHKHSAGPLGAIMAGMQKLATTTVNTTTINNDNTQTMLVISCDSLITASDVWSLIQNYLNSGDEGIDANDKNNSQPQANYCLSDDENLYPLLGLYSLDLKNELKDYLDNGGRRVMRFLEPKSQTIKMPQNWSSLSNLNTPEQFKWACQQVFNKQSND